MTTGTDLHLELLLPPLEADLFGEPLSGTAFTIDRDGYRFLGCELVARERLGDGRFALRFAYFLRSKLPDSSPLS